MNFAPSFENFKERLREHESETVTKYVLVDSRKVFTQKEIKITADLKVFWQNNVPFFHFGTRVYQCHQGTDRNVYQKKKYAESREKKALTDHCFIKRCKKIQCTKKLGCPAKVKVMRVFKMPNYKIQGKVTKKAKSNASAKVKNEILRCGTVLGEEGYVFNLPGVDEHKFHFIGKPAAVTEPVDERIRKYIADLVHQGKRSSAVIAELVRVYATSQLSQTDISRRRFFPDFQTVRRIVSQAKNKERMTKIDQKETETVVKSFDQSGCKVFFRPCTVPTQSEDCLCDDEVSQTSDQTKNNLLFVYQSSEMKQLYRRYGCTSILLDATYKTCKYAVPTYFVVVQTNVNFQVICVIITQFETKEALIEGLTLLKQWNNDVLPKYAMVDFALEEIGALECLFPNIKVYICSFHREQAWSRWLNKTKNSGVPREEALSLLRNVANARNEEEVCTAINKLKAWQFYEKTPVKEYFEKTWQKEIKRWAIAYKPVDMLLNSNNGVERLNEELKYRHLENLKNCNLSELITVLVQDFLPERYQMYVRKNLQMSNCHRKYDKSIPEYLLSRPKWLINRILTKLSEIPIANAGNIALVGEGVFEVPSETETGIMYTVQFNKSQCLCSCTCTDFKKNRIACKHVILVGFKYPMWSLNNIHTWLFSNPVYRCDESIIQDNAVLHHSDHEDTLTDREIETSCVADVETTDTSVYGMLKKRKHKRRQLINACNAKIRSIQSVLWSLPEQPLFELSNNLTTMFEIISKQVNTDESTGLPLEISDNDLSKKSKSQVLSIAANNSDDLNEACNNTYAKLPAPRVKKSKRVGIQADIIRASSNIHVSLSSHADVVTSPSE